MPQQADSVVLTGRRTLARDRRHARTIFERCGSRSPSAVGERFWAFVDRPDDEPDTCWTWTGAHNQDGYGRFDWSGAHRVSYWMATGEEPGVMNVLHRCDNPPCVRPSHLFLGTQAANMADMAVKLRGGRATKIPEAHVAEVRRRYLAGESAATLADEFGISRRHAARIVSGEHRGEVELPDWKRRGFQQSTDRLTDDQVREIRVTYAAGGTTQRELAARYDVTQSLISLLINRKHRNDVI